MSEQDAALSKIRRLMKLGESSNQHEAELALAKAAELARKHSIDLGSVKAEAERSRVAEETFASRLAHDQVEWAAGLLCKALFGVELLFNSTSATYIGLEHNVAAARCAHGFIMEQCGRDLAAYRRERWRRHRRKLYKGATEEYCTAWARAVLRNYEEEVAKVEKREELEDHKTAIILRDQEQEVADYMARNHPDVEVEKRRQRKGDNDAYYAGMRDGGKVSVRRPLAERGGENLQLEMEAV